MSQFFFLITSLVIILITQFNTVASGSDVQSDTCLKCHETVYRKSDSYRYQHSVVRDQCALCHIKPEEEDKFITRLYYPTLHREWLIHLDQLSPAQGYQAEITVKDRNGRKSSPSWIFIFQKELLEPAGELSSRKLEQLSGLMVNEIKKGGFVRAVISWNTDVPASTEIEYRLKDERGRTIKIADLYTRNHQIILNGLKHNSSYTFRAVSGDIHGNTVKSEEYTFDTTEELSRPPKTEKDSLSPPAIESLDVFRMTQTNSLFLKVSADKLSEISVEVKKMDDKHGYGFLPERYSKIDVCYKCHRHDSSHPVGVRALSPKIKTPEGLPTIEDGIITCVTCHNPHGGERIYYSRFDFKKNLCLRCHSDKYSM